MIPLADLRRGSQPLTPCALTDNLPNELLLQCLSELDARDLIRSRQVCCRWRELIDSDATLQYKIELWANDMIDGPPSEIGVEDRLRRLREYQERWDDCELICHSSAEFDHRDATWCIEAPSTDGSVAYRVSGDNFSNLVVVSPPSTLRHVDRRMWTVPLAYIPGIILSIATDAEQGLVLVATRPHGLPEITVHFLSLGNAGESHPEAVSPITLQPPPDVQMPHWLNLQYPQICGQQVAWLLSGLGQHSCEIEVWNWKAGKRIWKHSFGNHIIFSFLDPFHIAVIGKAFSPPNSLQIHRIVGTDSRPDTQPADKHDDLSQACAVALPLIHPDNTSIYVDRITCNARPTAGTITSGNAPFEHDPASSLVTIRFGVCYKDINPQFMLLVPARTLYREIEKASRCSADEHPSPVPWSDWGPSGSLFLPLTDHNHQSYLSLINGIEPFGSRFALPFHIPQEPRGLEHVVFLDFTRSAAQRQRTDPAVLDQMRHALLDPEEWKEIFAESVIRSTLPYRVTVGPDVDLVNCQAWPVSVRMVIQPDGFTVMYVRGYRYGPTLDMYHV
ncbi:hypothetical protein C8Q73DRAFT_718996 [Cubamyces lactineus]|nr:hypothetical protein C8Q73DRAFT_718996 [Cubamyces lactineus]